ncbi:MAG: hypothetical protein HC881_07470 [Leptolyngbyaceae cyanobacterium SL_7_1]|nr:hypothetical protein [Leptolyngbyaceae cyanobacterium SL_7_1]
MESLTYEHSTHGSIQENNHLTTIRGIGAIRKQWLNTLGIYTIADLAHASADEIEAQAKQDGRSIHRTELEEWIAQAQTQLANTMPQPMPQPENRPDDVDRVEACSDNPEDCLICGFSQSSLESSASPDEQSEWAVTAAFQVEYQTRQVEGRTEQQTVIRDLETNVVKYWQQFETQLIPQWILDRLDIAPLVAEPDAAMMPELVQIRLMQSGEDGRSMVATATDRLFPDAIHADVPFALELSIQFANLTAHSSQSLTYKVECLARELSAASTLDLGTITATVTLADQGVYTTRLSDLRLPKPGIYRLKGSIALQTALPSQGFKLPMLQVI